MFNSWNCSMSLKMWRLLLVFVIEVVLLFGYLLTGEALAHTYTQLLAYFNAPSGVAVDQSGSFYVADTDNNRIVKLDSQGIQEGVFDNGGTISRPSGIAVDGSGNIYVADTDNNRIVKLDSQGKQQGVFNSKGTFSGPCGVAVDQNGNIYVADTNNNRIVKIDSSGSQLEAWDNSNNSANTIFARPYGVAVDKSGNIYVADTNNNRIVKLDSQGIQQGVFDNYNGEAFSGPCGVAVDGSGNIFVADTVNKCLVKLDSSGIGIEKWTKLFNYSLVFMKPCGVAVDGYGNIYVADAHPERNRINAMISGNYKWFGGRTLRAFDLDLDVDGNIYVADKLTHLVAKFNSSGAQVATWGERYNQNILKNPSGVAVDVNGNIYVSDSGHYRIVKCDSGGIEELFKHGEKSDFPEDVAADGDGNIYVGYWNKECIAKFSRNEEGQWIFDKDISLKKDGESQCNPIGFAVDGGDIYAAVYEKNYIANMDSSNGYRKTDLENVNDAFNRPQDVYVDGDSNIYVADRDNKRIVKLDSNRQRLEALGELTEPTRVAAEGKGNIYVIDKENILKIITAPGVSSYSPTDNATGVGADTLVLIFNENVTAVEGKNIVIMKASDNSIVETIPVTDARVSGSGTATITINPETTLVGGESYYVQIDTGTFEDAAHYPYAGIADTSTWNFTVGRTAHDILTFTIPEQSGLAIIDNIAHKVNIQVAQGTILTSLTPTITVSDGAAIDPPSGTTQDFTAAVIYTVTAEDGTSQTWTVNIKVAGAAPPQDSGGGSSSTPSGTLVNSSGRTFSQNGVTFSFPAGATENDINVTIRQAAQNSGLNLPEGSILLSRIMDIVKDKSGEFQKPVTITISFDKSKLDADKYDITIRYYDEDKDEWIALDNISVNLENGKVSGDTTHFTKFAVIAVPKNKEEKPQPPAPQPSIKIPGDISAHWAKESIMKVINAGVVSGYPDGTFLPDKTISRAEYTVMLIKALKLQNQAGKTFNDTATHWAKDSISTAVANGFISGYDKNTFGPDDPITREQAAAIIARAAKVQTVTEELKFTDSKAISPWAQGGVAAAVKGAFFSGYPDGNFKPQANMTRAEAATIIGKLL